MVYKVHKEGVSEKTGITGIREILEEWDNVREFLDNVLNPNLTKSKNEIQDSVLLYMINKLKEYSCYQIGSAEGILCDLEEDDGTDEEKEEKEKLLKEWTNVNNSLSDIQTICDNLSQEMEKLNQSITD